MKVYAYIRVSSKDQNTQRQEKAMMELGLTRRQMFIDKESGKDFERKAYKRLLKKLKAGDVLYIKSIDRLGRNYEEIIRQWSYLTKEKKVDIVVLDFPLLDTRRNESGLTGAFLTDLILQILSYVAQMERENIKQRQREGIQCAKEAGVRFGRPRKKNSAEFTKVYQLWKEEKISKRKAAVLLQTNCTTLRRWIENYEKEELQAKKKENPEKQV